MDDNLQRAIALIKKGQKKEGGLLLAEIVKQEPQNESAWLWLSNCLSNNQQKIDCLAKVLEINPQNEVAHKALHRLQSEQEYQFADNRPIKNPWKDRWKNIGCFLAAFLCTIVVMVLLYWFFLTPRY